MLEKTVEPLRRPHSPDTALNVLSISATFPSIAEPTRGLFVKERLKALANLPNVNLQVLSPTPWFPPIKWLPKWYRWSQYPHQETFDGLQVDNPRYFLPPKLGGYFHPQLIDLAMARQVHRIRQKFPFDLIDAHWVYPAGAWAVKLGQRFGVPVIMTGRGEDMARFPDLPLVGKKIRWALKRADGCIGVSREITELMIRHGATAATSCTIPNGIDTNKFYLKDQAECRIACGLPVDRRIVLSVGDCLEIKGFHLIVQAIANAKTQFPDILYVIVGGPGRYGRDHSAVIQSQIDKLKLNNHVRMVGPKPHDELIDWYNSADLYAMMSSREGSPNVLLEALACGTPAVGTAVGGIRDELLNELFGSLIDDRSHAAAAEAIVSELQKPKSRKVISQAMQDRSWSKTANHVHQFMLEAVANHRKN